MCYLSAFAFLVGIAIRITSFADLTTEIKKYKSIIKKKKKKHDKITLLTKFKLSSIEVLIYKALFDSNISHDEFV